MSIIMLEAVDEELRDLAVARNIHEEEGGDARTLLMVFACAIIGGLMYTGLLWVAFRLLFGW
jgi:hypothetical protein